MWSGDHRPRRFWHASSMATWRDRSGGEPNRLRSIRVLAAAEAAGCSNPIPDCKRCDYVNIRPPMRSRRRGRIASVQVNTGSVEFQDGSWSRLRESTGFRHLNAGDKAARTVDSDADVEAI